MSDQQIDDKDTITIRSMYGSRTRQPLVSLRVKDVAVTLVPSVAREIGVQLIEAAEAAMCDAAVFRVAVEHLNGDDRHAAMLLQAFRAKREEIDTP